MAFVKPGEPIDWSAIIAEHGGLVWQTADRILRNREDVEDCFQETFVAAVKLARRRQINNWPATLRHIAAARAIDRLRQRIAQQRYITSAKLVGVASNAAAPNHPAESNELAERLRIAIAQLPAKYAEVFCLHELMEQSDKEISRAMGLKPGTVRVLLHRSRAKLRELIKIEE